MASPHRIQDALRSAVAEGVAPALAFAVQRGEQRWRWFAGREGPEAGAPACGPTTRFDLASLTKPLTTVTWALRLATQGKLDLHGPVAAVLPELTDPRWRTCPIWRLLNHSTGLPAWRPYHQGLQGAARHGQPGDFARAAVRRMLARTPLEADPGQRETYSDLGFLALEWICERLDEPLASAWRTLPGHGPDALHFRPLPLTDDGRGYAPTEQCPWRGRLLRGEVHDDNTWVLGGLAGHAGLFGSLDATLAATRGWLTAVRGEGSLPGIDGALTRSVLDSRWGHPQGSFALGWDTPTPGASTSGRRFQRPSMGHLGFTGTSIWMDVSRDVCMVLLTNRVSPSRDNDRHRPFRPRLHDVAWAMLDAHPRTP
ncbi:MAG: beta-lactamase family protein [Myxococcales bacterium]|nr:beta-lactamase family protein [Myxococcales bacterium]